MNKMTLIAGSLALSVGLLQSTSFAIAHGHSGNHSSGHHSSGHHSGSHHNGGHHSSGHHSSGHHHHNNDGNFWAGAAIGGLILYGAANAQNNPCNDVNYRATYPGNCGN